MKRKLFFITSGSILVILITSIVINIYVYEQGKKYIVTSSDSVEHAQVAIILGAAVSSKGIPSSVLEDRIITAIELYKKGVVDKILMSGGNPTITNNEVNPVRKILIAKGIPSSDIFLDHAGFDTYSTMYRARNIFNVTSAIVVTQGFHLPRAVYLARSVGINAYGVPADRGSYLNINYLRELLARPNAFFELLIHRIPKYLGPMIPITGDGSVT